MVASRTFHFENRPTRAVVIDTIRAALADEGLTLQGGSWGRVVTVIKDGELIAVVPSSVITRSTP